MAGVKLTSEARAKVKLLVDFYRRYYPHDTIDRDRVIDWAISDLQPLDCHVVWNGKNYALECRACGFVAVRPPTMLQHFRQCPESTDSTLHMRAHGLENDTGNSEPGVLTQVEPAYDSTNDIDAMQERSDRRPSEIRARVGDRVGPKGRVGE